MKYERLKFYILGIILLLFFHTKSNAQQRYLCFNKVDTLQDPNIVTLFKQSVSNIDDTLLLKLTVEDQLHQLRSQAHSKGFLAFAIDSLYAVNDTIVQADIYIGNAYKWAQLHLDSMPKMLLSAINVSEKDFAHKVINPKQYAQLCKKILTHYENNGYPFATVYLDITAYVSDGIEAYLKINQHQLVKIDTMIVTTDVKISRNYLQNYLGIQSGDKYNEKALKDISKKIKELPFLQESQPNRVSFSIADTRLWLYLKQKKSNQINGLIGLQPNSTQNGSRFLLTVDALLHLKNALGYGETIAAIFQQLQPASPRFNFKFEYPYISNTPFSVDFVFDLYKKDSLFNRISLDAGVKYLLNSRDYVRLAYINTSNRIISPDLQYVLANKKLPNNIDVLNNGASLGFYFDKTDYIFNPRKGYTAQLNAQFITRAIKKNAAITALVDGSGFDYATIYDTLPAKLSQYKLQGVFSWYVPLAKQIVFKAAYNGGYISGKQLFMNELYQIGGFALLRGFDELSFFVNQYHVATAELRFLFNQNSFFYLFSDNAYIQSNYNNLNQDNIPMGLGLGLNLENPGGVFKIAVGVGKQEGSGFMLRQSKLHFGYVAFF